MLMGAPDAAGCAKLNPVGAGAGLELLVPRKAFTAAAFSACASFSAAATSSAERPGFGLSQ